MKPTDEAIEAGVAAFMKAAMDKWDVVEDLDAGVEAAYKAMRRHMIPVETNAAWKQRQVMQTFNDGGHHDPT